MERRAFRLALISLLIAAGCTHGPMIAPGFDARTSATQGVGTPSVVQSGGQSGVWRFLAYPSPWGEQQTGIVVGPDKNLWVGDVGQSALFRITMLGKVKIFSGLTANVGGTAYTLDPGPLVLGPDGRFWMTTNSQPSSTNGLIAAVTTSGTASAFATVGEPSSSSRMLVGPDGNLWTPLSTHIARITTAGAITLYPYGTSSNSGYSNDIAVGPDGDIWFTERYNGKVGKIKPGMTTVTEYTVPSTANGSCLIYGLANGGDGFLYAVGDNCIVNNTEVVLKIATTGKVTARASLPIFSPYDMIRGPDGKIWISIYNQTLLIYDQKNNVFATISPPTSIKCYSGQLVTGPDGNMWDAGIGTGVCVYLRKILTVTPTSVSLSGVGQATTLQGSETGNPTLSASSSNTSVATVAPGAAVNSFTVTATGAGHATIQVNDKVKNLFDVPVTVL